MHPFFNLETPTFNNDDPIRNERPLIETRLLRCLRDWRVAPDATLDCGRTLLEEIRGLLEYYICGCLSYGPKNLCGWWSDGVIHLEISERVRDHFKLLGVTWIDSLGISPFEIDVELDPNNNKYFAKTVFRIGTLDSYGRPSVCDRNLATMRVLELRPRYNRDWAMAVELTAPTNVTEPSDAPKQPNREF
jgi:hypothetical protein